MRRARPYQLSQLQEKILDAIALFCKNNRGISPTIREICEQVGITSTSHAEYHLRQLQKFGRIERVPGISRSIRLVVQEVEDSPQSSLGFVSNCFQRQIPILGRIQAGLPIPIPASDFSLFDQESALEIAASLLPRKTEGLYALEVQGDSMIDAMVADGDIVVLRSVSTANNGEMVAAWLKQEGETTLKRYYLENGRVRLQPANQSYQPIYADPENVQIQGQVVLIIRKLDQIH